MNDKKKRKQANKHPAQGDTGNSREKHLKDIRSFHKIIASSRDYTGALEKGIACIIQNDDAKAIEWLDQALASQPDNAEVHYQLGIAYAHLGETDKATGAYLKVIELNPGYFEAYCGLGNLCLKQNDNAGAIKWYHQALALDPAYAEAYHNLGDAYCRQGDYTRAIESFLASIRLMPGNTKAYSNLGDIYYAQGNPVKAVGMYRGAIRVNPGNAAAHLGLGVIYHDQGNLVAAEGAYRAAIAAHPGFVEAYNNLGSIYGEQGDSARAAEAYSKALELAPDFAGAHYNLGVICCKLGDLSRGIAAFRAAVALKPDYAEAYGSLGKAYADQGNHAEALEAYHKGMQLRPDEATLYFHAGEIYAQQGDPDKALEAYVKALELRPDDPRPYFNVAMIYAKRGDLELAIKAYSKIIELKQDESLAYYIRGQLFLLFLTKDIALDGIEINRNHVMMDWNACIYLSRGPGRLKIIRDLVKFFEPYPRTILAIRDYSGAKPDSLDFDAFEEAGRSIADFTALFRWHEYTIPDKRKILGMKGVLYNYLGGPVPSYIIFDEEMRGEALSAWEYYHYVLAAKKINWKFDAVLARAIGALEKQKEKKAGDFYYLGHFYMARGDRARAIETFRLSGDFIFSTIMLACLSGDPADMERVRAINPADIYNFSTVIDPSRQDLSQFQHFFHLRECASAIASFGKEVADVLMPDEYDRSLWEVFRLADAEKFADDLRVVEAKHVLRTLQGKFRPAFDRRAPGEKKPAIDTVEEFFSNHYRDWQAKHDPAGEKQDHETQIGLSIQAWRVDGFEFYLLVLQLAYLLGWIDARQVFTLYFYLLYTAGKKQPGCSLDPGKIVPHAGVNLLLVSPLTARTVITGVITGYKQNFLNNPGTYACFRESFWQYIANDKKTLSSSDFEQRYRCFDWYEKG